MTLDEAKKELSEWYPDCSLALHPTFPKAVKLGAEALALLIRARDNAEIHSYPLLPSETLE